VARRFLGIPIFDYSNLFFNHRVLGHLIREADCAVSGTSPELDRELGRELSLELRPQGGI